MNDNKVEPVHSNEKLPWHSVMFVWVGVSITMSAIISGAALIATNTFYYAALAGVLGFLLVAIISILQGVQGSDTGLPTAMIARKTFGTKGSKAIFSFTLAIALTGWFGVQGGVAGAAIKNYLEFYHVDAPLWLMTVIAGVLMVITTLFGINSMKYLNYLAVPFMIIIILWATISAFSVNDLSVLLEYKPKQEGSLVASISIVTGAFVVGAVIASDYTRYNKTRKDTFKAAFVGIVPIGILLKVLGVMLAIFAVTAGKDATDITTIFFTYIPYPTVVFLMILLACWTTNVGNAYSGGLAIANGLSLKKEHYPYAIAFSGLVGTTLAALGILGKITTFLLLLTALIAPIAGVMIADYWLVNKGKPERFINKEPKAIAACMAWILGCAPYFLNKIFTLPAIENYISLSGILISIMSYLLLRKLIK